MEQEAWCPIKISSRKTDRRRWKERIHQQLGKLFKTKERKFIACKDPSKHEKKPMPRLIIMKTWDAGAEVLSSSTSFQGGGPPWGPGIAVDFFTAPASSRHGRMAWKVLSEMDFQAGFPSPDKLSILGEDRMKIFQYVESWDIYS